MRSGSDMTRQAGGVARWTVGLLLVLLGCTATESGDDSGRSSTDEPRTTSTAEAGGDGSGWTVVEVVDGDTIQVAGPDGRERVRLIGINAPEQGECFYDRATAVLQELVAGSEVRLVRDVSDRDRFDRLLRFVETVDGEDIDGEHIDGGDVNGELVRLGAARSQRFEPDVSRNDLYDELQSEAQEDGRGLWAPDACGAPLATDGVDIAIEIRYDAPGDDNTNLNGEWVRFINDGDELLDLTGWQVADESSTHRYRFDELTLRPGGSVTLFTGCGSDSPTERYWCKEDSAVWNNSGDTVFLQDPSGNVVVSESYRE